LREGFTAKFLDETVRVMRRRHAGHPDRQAGGQQNIQGADRGALSGIIGIKAQHHLLHVTLEDAGVVRGQRRPLRSDNIVDAAHETGDQIKLALADYRPMRIQQSPL
jgi:hypothetical protein